MLQNIEECTEFGVCCRTRLFTEKKITKRHTHDNKIALKDWDSTRELLAKYMGKGLMDDVFTKYKHTRVNNWLDRNPYTLTDAAGPRTEFRFVRDKTQVFDLACTETPLSGMYAARDNAVHFEVFAGCVEFSCLVGRVSGAGYAIVVRGSRLHEDNTARPVNIVELIFVPKRPIVKLDWRTSEEDPQRVKVGAGNELLKWLQNEKYDLGEAMRMRHPWLKHTPKAGANEAESLSEFVLRDIEINVMTQVMRQACTAIVNKQRARVATSETEDKENDDALKQFMWENFGFTNKKASERSVRDNLKRLCEQAAFLSTVSKTQIDLKKWFQLVQNSIMSNSYHGLRMKNSLANLQYRKRTPIVDKPYPFVVRCTDIVIGNLDQVVVYLPTHALGLEKEVQDQLERASYSLSEEKHMIPGHAVFTVSKSRRTVTATSVSYEPKPGREPVGDAEAGEGLPFSTPDCELIGDEYYEVLARGSAFNVLKEKDGTIFGNADGHEKLPAYSLEHDGNCIYLIKVGDDKLKDLNNRSWTRVAPVAHSNIIPPALKNQILVRPDFGSFRPIFITGAVGLALLVTTGPALTGSAITEALIHGPTAYFSLIKGTPYQRKIFTMLPYNPKSNYSEIFYEHNTESQFKSLCGDAV